MAILGSDRGGMRTRHSRLHRMQPLAALTFACAMVLGSLAASAQFTLPDEIPAVDPSKPPVDSGVCEVTKEARDNWIKRSADLVALETAFKAAYVALGTAPDNMFSHNTSDTEGVKAARDTARQALREQGDKLYEWAEIYAGKQLKSCDDCYLFDKWGHLARIAITSGSVDGSMTKPGDGTSAGVTHNVTKLSRAQVEDKAVQTNAQAYVKNLAVLSEAKPAPQFASVSAAADLAACRRSFDATKGLLDKDKCNKAHVQSFLNGWRNAVVDALTAADARSSGPRVEMRNLWANKNDKLRCEPKKSFSQMSAIQFLLDQP